MREKMGYKLPSYPHLIILHKVVYTKLQILDLPTLFLFLDNKKKLKAIEVLLAENRA